MSIEHTDPEWEQVRQLARQLFKASRDRGDLAGTDVEVWRLIWPEMTPEMASHALGRRARAGEVWMPTAAELGEFLEIPNAVDSPPFASVFAAVDGLRFHGGEGVLRMQDLMGPVAAAWMASVGTGQLRQMRLADPEYGQITYRDLERSYGEFVKDQAECANSGRALARVDAQGQLPSRRSGLRRMDLSATQSAPVAPARPRLANPPTEYPQAVRGPE